VSPRPLSDVDVPASDFAAGFAMKFGRALAVPAAERRVPKVWRRAWMSTTRLSHDDFRDVRAFFHQLNALMSEKGKEGIPAEKTYLISKPPPTK